MKKFYKLRPGGNLKISNSQILELAEFKYCPFKANLIKALGLNNDRALEKIENALDSRRIIYNRDENYEMNLDPNAYKEKKILNNVEAMQETDRRNKEQKLTLINNNFIKSEDRERKQQTIGKAKLINDTEKDSDYIGSQNISFLQFCKIMMVFSKKARVEVKIKCKIIDNLYI